MNDLQKRWAMFLGLCIPARFLLAYIASKLSPKHLKIMGIILTIPIVGWVFIYLTKSRQTGGETLGAPIWWDHLRPLHAALYFIFVLIFYFNFEIYLLHFKKSVISVFFIQSKDCLLFRFRFHHQID